MNATIKNVAVIATVIASLFVISACTKDNYKTIHTGKKPTVQYTANNHVIDTTNLNKQSNLF